MLLPRPIEDYDNPLLENNQTGKRKADDGDEDTSSYFCSKLLRLYWCGCVYTLDLSMRVFYFAGRHDAA